MQKILTIGPSSEKGENLVKLVKTATSIRINIAHISPEKMKQTIDRILETARKLKKRIEVILDLQGAKTRIGKLPEQHLSGKVMLQYSRIATEPGLIPIPHENVFKMSKRNDLLFINDRKVEIMIKRRLNDHTFEAEVIKEGVVSSGKGINSPDKHFEISRVSLSDEIAIELGNKYQEVNYAVSFLFDGSEAELFRPLVKKKKLIAKIEQSMVFNNLDVVMNNFDELWLCRGDLGSEVGMNKLGVYQELFDRQVKFSRKPCILAGEVLGSMVELKWPSRSEIVHLHYAIKKGYKGIVLSDETASGKQFDAVINFLNEYF